MLAILLRIGRDLARADTICCIGQRGGRKDSWPRSGHILMSELTSVERATRALWLMGDSNHGACHNW